MKTVVDLFYQHPAVYWLAAGLVSFFWYLFAYIEGEEADVTDLCMLIMLCAAGPIGLFVLTLSYVVWRSIWRSK